MTAATLLRFFITPSAVSPSAYPSGLGEAIFLILGLMFYIVITPVLVLLTSQVLQEKLKDIARHFESMQKKLKAVTTGRVFSMVNKPLREIEELAQNRGISSDNSALKELDAALAEADSAEGEIDED